MLQTMRILLSLLLLICCVAAIEENAKKNRKLRQIPRVFKRSSAAETPSLNIPKDSLRKAAQMADIKMRNLQKEEKRVIESRSKVDVKSASAQHAGFSQSSEEDKKVSMMALVNLEATKALKDMLELSSTEAGLGLKSHTLLNTSTGVICPDVPVCDPAAKYQTFDGSCNNLLRPNQGKARTALSRLLLPVYGDGIGTPRDTSYTGNPLKSAREVSSIVSPDIDKIDPKATLLVMVWGQFIVHDISHSPMITLSDGNAVECCDNGEFIPEADRHFACNPIVIPDNDTFYQPFGQKCMNLAFTMPALTEGCTLGFKEQMDVITTYIDASLVYGSNEDRALLLRDGPYLRTQLTDHGTQILPPSVSTTDGCTDLSNNKICFVAGDNRVNEQIDLMIIHLLFVREHNRIVEELEQINPDWSNDTLYFEARRIVAAILQHVTYKEYLPIILGKEYMKQSGIQALKFGYLDEYDEDIDTTTTNEFSTAAFRFGHSQIQQILRLLSGHPFVDQGFEFLHNNFNNPELLFEAGKMDELINGMVKQKSQKTDVCFSESVSNRLFQKNGLFGMDLVAINTHRGREHGLPPYNDYRELCGLPKAQSFDDLYPSMALDVIESLQEAYDDVNDIDLFIGGLAENTVDGAIVGSTFQCIIGDMFTRLRLGDRFAYDVAGQPGSFTPAQLYQLRKSSMAGIICDNSDDIEFVQPQVFKPIGEYNQRIPCFILPRPSFHAWAEPA